MVVLRAYHHIFFHVYAKLGIHTSCNDVPNKMQVDSCQLWINWFTSFGFVERFTVPFIPCQWQSPCLSYTVMSMCTKGCQCEIVLLSHQLTDLCCLCRRCCVLWRRLCYRKDAIVLWKTQWIKRESVSLARRNSEWASVASSYIQVRWHRVHLQHLPSGQGLLCSPKIL